MPEYRLSAVMNLKYRAVSGDLIKYLRRLMEMPCLHDYCLVGGTNLALRRGHRKSVDIDLFAGVNYLDVDIKSIVEEVKKEFDIVTLVGEVGEHEIGVSMYLQDLGCEEVKLDLWHVDSFVFPIETVDGIRMADIREIAAMKLSAVIGDTVRREKDFWDIYELLEVYSLGDMIEWAKLRYPYSFEEAELIQSIGNVENVERAQEGIVDMKGNEWDLIKMDLREIASQYRGL